VAALCGPKNLAVSLGELIEVEIGEQVAREADTASI